MATSPASDRAGMTASQAQSQTISAGKRATRLAFFVAGFALACWAPLVPFAQARMQADSATLGSILLCLGFGAVLGMPLASSLSVRIGTKPLIIAGSVGLVLTVPMLSTLSTPATLGVCLALFGACIGAIDVAANIHGIAVQDLAKAPLMSGFHGLYSLGGLIGASGMTALLASGVAVPLAAGLAALVVLACVVFAAPGFLSTKSTEKAPLLVLPKGRVIIIGALLFIIFLAEGAMLDWSAILLTQHKQVEVSQAGIGYAVFAVAMAVSRLLGDRLMGAVGERRVLIHGFILTGVGLAIVAWAASYPVVLAGMLLAGLAAGNIVPALFNLTGRQKVMPPAQAVAAISVLGYLGILAGPGLIGHAAQFIGLVEAFCAVAVIVACMAGVVRVVAEGRADVDHQSPAAP